MHTHEEVVGVGVGATNLEQLHQVVELAMNITTDSNWAFLVMRDQLDGPSWFPLSAGLSMKHTTGCTFDSSCKTSRAYDIASASCLINHRPITRGAKNLSRDRVHPSRRIKLKGEHQTAVASRVHGCIVLGLTLSQSL